jgi:glycosyltransferase involved in cell wall biosynthesis
VIDKTVSVIIPVYNGRRTIRKCLSSLVRQGYGVKEIIVIDDGSTDDTRDIVREFGVKLLRQEHKGPGAARNLGVSKAAGEIIVFVDSDEYCGEDYVKNLIRPILESKTIGTVSTDVHVANADNQWAKCWSISHGLSLSNLSIRIAETDIFRAVLRSKFLEAGGFEESIGYSDDRLAQKLGVKAYTVGNARFEHEYPSSLKDIYKHAVWIGKGEDSRKHPFINIVVHFFPISLARGFIKSLKYHEWSFIIFKTIFDFGLIVGVIKAVFMKEYSK